MKRAISLFAVLFIIAISSQLFSQEETSQSKGKYAGEFKPGWAIGVKASSLGFGLELVKSFSPKFNLRLGGSYYKQNYNLNFLEDFDAIGVTYTSVGSVTLIADWQISRIFHISGGVMYNMTTMEVESKATEYRKIGTIDISPETQGSIYYQLNPNDICPYLGIGIGNTISPNKVVSFNFDLGAVYQGSPKVVLEATGMVAPTANEEQRQLLENNVKEYRFFPLINFQLGFRIF